MNDKIQNLIDRKAAGEVLDFEFFWGHTANVIDSGIFSQWYSSPFDDENGIRYVSAEQYMMAEKARTFSDLTTLQHIMETSSPQKAKSLGRLVSNYDDVIWSKVRYDIVLKGNVFKFTQNAGFTEYLLSTGTKIIVEASPYDKVWGIGLHEDLDEHKVTDPAQWKGENLLGFAIMDLRDMLRNA